MVTDTLRDHVDESWEMYMNPYKIIEESASRLNDRTFTITNEDVAMFEQNTPPFTMFPH